jgi:hypothetical protein
VFLIDRPLIPNSKTHFPIGIGENCLKSREARDYLRHAASFLLMWSHCASASVRPETPTERLIPIDPTIENGCKPVERPVPPNKRLAPTPTPTPGRPPPMLLLTLNGIRVAGIPSCALHLQRKRRQVECPDSIAGPSALTQSDRTIRHKSLCQLAHRCILASPEATDMV